MLLNLDGNSLQSLKYQAQVEASLPLKKQLWQQTVIVKIQNQASLFAIQREENKYLLNLLTVVKSGDPDNYEAQAAAYYWKRIFPAFLEFRRERYGPPPNNLLNYGYAILRAIVARSLVASTPLDLHQQIPAPSFTTSCNTLIAHRTCSSSIGGLANNFYYYALNSNFMKRMLAISALVAITAIGTAFTGYSYSNNKHHETCKGSRYCTACKNCSRCAHCAKNGGSCGVCK